MKSTINTYKVAIVAIAKQEEEFIKEWVAYHYILGVDHIFLYDNGHTPGLAFILDEFSDFVTIRKIKKKRFSKELIQRRAYKHSFFNGLKDYKWSCFLDLDEFIVLNKHKDIHTFLESYEDTDQILLHWKIFGHSGQFNSPESVINSLIYRHRNTSEIVKCIVQTKDLRDHEILTHFCKIKNGITVNARKEVVTPYMKIPVKNGFYDAHINHYHCRSYKHFANRIKRGEVGQTKELWRQNEAELIKKFVTYFSFHCNKTLDCQIQPFSFRVENQLKRRKKNRIQYKNWLNRNLQFSLAQWIRSAGSIVINRENKLRIMIEKAKFILALKMLGIINKNKKTTPIFIISGARTGSTLLGSGLSSSPEIFYGNEIDNKYLVSGSASQKEVIKKLQAQLNASRQRFFLAKLIIPTTDEHLVYQIAKNYPDARFIILYRENTFNQLRSLKKAIQTNTWHDFKSIKRDIPEANFYISAEEMDTFYADNKKFYTKIIKTLRKYQSNFYILSYEDFTMAQNNTLDVLCKFIGLKPFKMNILTKKITKQKDVVQTDITDISQYTFKQQ